jgi:hypothetical protein
MDPHQTRIQAQEELLLAKQSRLEGNEGRARVCARRAAGSAVKSYLDRKGLISGSESALKSLMIFGAEIDLPVRVQKAVSWLIRRVDQDYSLPDDVDLIHEAHIVLDYLEAADPGLTRQ